MKDCKEFLEDIIRYQEIEAERQAEIRRHLASCERCKEAWKQMGLLELELRRWRDAGHPSPEELHRYALSSIGGVLTEDQELSKQEKKKLAKHISQCPFCHESVEAIVDEFTEIDQFLAEAGVPEIEIAPPSVERPLPLGRKIMNWFSRLGELIPAPVPRFALAPVAAAVLMILIWFSPIIKDSTNPYFAMAVVSQKEFASVTRSAGSPLIQMGFSYLQKREYRLAAGQFEKAAAEAVDPNNRAYLLELAGISYLLSSPKSVFGKLKQFDKKDLVAAEQQLECALELAENLRLREEILWYLTKVYLGMKDTARAKGTLNDLLALKGPRYHQAVKLMARLEQIQ